MLGRAAVAVSVVGLGLLGGVAATVLSPTAMAALVAACVAVACLLRLDWWRRWYAACIVLFTAATSAIPAVVEAVYWPRYAALGMLVLVTWHGHQDEKRRLSEAGQAGRLLVTGLWVAVVLSLASTVWSVDPSRTVVQAVILGALAALVHGLVVRRWADGERVAGDLAVAAAILSTVFAVGLVAVQLGLVEAVPATHPSAGRLRGLYENPNALGMMAALVLPILWGLWRLRRHRVYLLAAVPAMASLVLSESRTAILAVVLVVVAAVLWGRVNRVNATLSLLGLTVVGYLVHTAGLVTIPSLGHLAARFTEAAGVGPLSGRIVAWSSAWDLWEQSPVLGYGYSAGTSLFENLRSVGQLRQFDPDVVHNSYLQWLLELGLLGLIPMVFIFRAWITAIFRSRATVFGAALGGSVSAGLLVQVTESAMFGTGSAYPFVFWLAVAGALTQVGVLRLQRTDLRVQVSDQRQ